MDQTLSQEDSEAQIYEAIGQAISAFSMAELLLCNHFALITQMSPEVAKAVYFSARSLQGRLDMVASALGAVGSAIDFRSLVPFMKVAKNRLEKWAAVRNMLAHSTVTYISMEGSKYEGQTILVDGSTSDWPNPKKVLIREQIINARDTFGRLSGLLMVGYSRGGVPNETTLKECHELCLQLPTVPTEPERRKPFLRRLTRLLPDGVLQGNLP